MPPWFILALLGLVWMIWLTMSVCLFSMMLMAPLHRGLIIGKTLPSATNYLAINLSTHVELCVPLGK